jgi:predicted TIM-barrel fold metal-dependent hydrolase
MLDRGCGPASSSARSATLARGCTDKWPHQRALPDDKFFWLVLNALNRSAPIYLHPQIPPAGGRHVLQRLRPDVSRFVDCGMRLAHRDGVHCIRLIMGGVFDWSPALQIIVGHNLEILS